jgi:hypothetical protein
MACNYTIKIGNESYTILKGIEEGKIKDIDDLKNYLRTIDLKTLIQIKASSATSDTIQDIDLSDINENSVGLFSPADLFKEVSSNIQDAAL